MFIPKYELMLIPALFCVYAHYAVKKGGGKKLLIDSLILGYPLCVLSYCYPLTTTYYHAHLASGGIMSVQIPIAIAAIAGIAYLVHRLKWNRILIYLIAIPVGEVLLIQTWIS